MSTDAANAYIPDMRPIAVPPETRVNVQLVGDTGNVEALTAIAKWFGQVNCFDERAENCGICILIPQPGNAVTVQFDDWLIISPFFKAGGQDALIYVYRHLEKNFELRSLGWFLTPGRIYGA